MHWVLMPLCAVFTVQPKKGDNDMSYLFLQHEVTFFNTYVMLNYLC